MRSRGVPAVELRPAADEDADYLGALVLADALVDLEMVPDPPRSDLARMQVRARRAGYAAQWPDALDAVVLLEGERVGRVLVHTARHSVYVVDLRLEARVRGCGVGTQVLTAVCAAAEAQGQSVTLHVRAGSSIEQWYRRWGFVDDDTTSGADGEVGPALDIPLVRRAPR